MDTLVHPRGRQSHANILPKNAHNTWQRSSDEESRRTSRCWRIKPYLYGHYGSLFSNQPEASLGVRRKEQTCPRGRCMFFFLSLNRVQLVGQHSNLAVRQMFFFDRNGMEINPANFRTRKDSIEMEDSYKTHTHHTVSHHCKRSPEDRPYG